MKQHLGHVSNLGLSQILMQIGQNPDVQTKTEFGAEFIETHIGMFLSQWQVKLSTNLPTKNDAQRYPLLAGGASRKKNSCQIPLFSGPWRPTLFVSKGRIGQDNDLKGVL